MCVRVVDGNDRVSRSSISYYISIQDFEVEYNEKSLSNNDPCQFHDSSDGMDTPLLIDLLDDPCPKFIPKVLMEPSIF